jgi:S-adenosyl-L-methionine methyltransferase
MENGLRPKTGGKAALTRLEKLLYRLEAQHAVLAWAFEQISGREGIVFELGLGKGRTFDHLRRHLPGRQIWVFEREIDAIPDCVPDPAFLIEGDIAATLPAAAARFSGQVVLAHSDVGSFDHERNIAMAKVVSAGLPRALAPGGLVLSDLPLELAGTEQLALPTGTRQDRYFIYRQLGRSTGE